IIQKEDGGLAQAWLMATVGTSKTAYRRTLKRELKDVSIPKICDEVTSIASEARHLRLTSNLLYGLSLIYKQKVAYMATDLSLVCDRITSPLFTKKVVSHGYTADPKTSAPVTRLACKPDSANFEMELDFFSEFHDSEEEDVALSKSDQNALAIRCQDKDTNGETGLTIVPAYIAADAKDKLFMEFMDKTMSTKEILLDEDLTVDFEFNQDGELVGHEGSNQLIQEADFLRDLNLEEDLVAVSGSFEDFSKSNQTDEHVCLRLHRSKAIPLDTGAAKTHKRRKLKPIYDEITTVGNERRLTESPCKSLSSPNSVSNVFYDMSLTQPPFLNMCYKIIFGSFYTASMSAANLPLSTRHPTISKLDSFLREFDEIEQGRNVPSRRPSLS
ncbi:hypothetical protein METBIDRAFT_15794, partial [Metschnikowia bicuspidata var. bicuspidata NRRL YB-4993]